LRDLGFSKVVGILDADKISIAIQLQEKYRDYLFSTIPAPDIRTKPARQASEKIGLLDNDQTTAKTAEFGTDRGTGPRIRSQRINATAVLRRSWDRAERVAAEWLDGAPALAGDGRDHVSLPPQS
jgi:hypothetical protein